MASNATQYKDLKPAEALDKKTLNLFNKVSQQIRP